MSPPKRGIGRGLEAILSVSAEGQGAPEEELRELPVELIAPNPRQPRRRFDEEGLAALAASLGERGMLQPVLVRPRTGGAYELVAGERRWRAARIAGLSVVPIVVRELDDHAALEMSLVENLMREDLNPVDEAHGFERLVCSFAMSHDQVAARIGKSRPYVSNAIRLLDLPPAVLEMLERGELSAGQARPLLAMASAEAQTVAARRIVEGRISARGAEELAGAARRVRGGSIRGAASIDPNLAALAEGMQRGLKRKVRIVRARGRKPGRIEIEFYGVDDLSALAATLGAAARTHAVAS
jgi:ParB family transcriptional regulator, chromosome partitioning protein